MRRFRLERSALAPYLAGRFYLLAVLFVLQSCAAGTPSNQNESDWWVLPIRSENEPRRPAKLMFTRAFLPENSPIPTSLEERVVFTLLYETLTTIDAEGNATGILAESWSVDATDLHWSFKLADRRYSDGSRLQSRDVWLSWHRSRARCPNWSFWSKVDRVENRGGEVHVWLFEPCADFAGLLADPRLAVGRLREYGQFALGTGSHRLVSNEGRAVPSQPRAGVQSWRLEPVAGFAAEPLEVRIFPHADVRDLSARGADILFARTQSESEFFHSRSQEWDTFALASDQIYSLASPSPWPHPISLDRLATLAVDQLARPWDIEGMESAPIDPALSSSTSSTSSVKVLWFEEKDPTSRALALRLAGEFTPPLRVEGKRAEFFWSDLRDSYPGTFSSGGSGLDHDLDLDVGSHGETIRAASLRHASIVMQKRYTRTLEREKAADSTIAWVGLVGTYPLLVVKRGVRGVGKSVHKGLDLSTVSVRTESEL